jgi:YD repeat-containing protein
VRPQTRLEYVQRTAWLKNASGGYSASPPIWVKSKESFCRTSAATGVVASPCATVGDQVATLYEYGPDSAPNNLLVRGTAVTADGVTLRTCFAYDRFGNRISETSPRAGVVQCP